MKCSVKLLALFLLLIICVHMLYTKKIRKNLRKKYNRLNKKYKRLAELYKVEREKLSEMASNLKSKIIYEFKLIINFKTLKIIKNFIKIAKFTRILIKKNT